MNKKILLVAILLLVVGAVVALRLSRSPHEDDAQTDGSPAVTATPRPGAPRGSQTVRGQPAATAAVKTGARTTIPAFSDEQIDRIVGLCRQAGSAYAKGDYQQAQILANKALDLDPNNQFALRIAGSASCALKMQSNAQAVYNRLSPSSPRRRLLLRVCKRHGVTLATGPQLDAGPAATATGAPAAAGEARGTGAAAAAAPQKLTSTAVTATIKRVRKEIEHCIKGTGIVRVRLTVEASGKVTDAAVMGQHAATPTGACVKEVVLKMTFPSFSGPPRTFIFPFIKR